MSRTRFNLWLLPLLGRRRSILLTVLALAGCGASSGDGAAHDGGGDATGADFAGLDVHPPLPRLKPHAGVVLGNPRLITVTFPGYAFRDRAEAFGDFVFGSEWWKRLGGEYGVLGGTHLEKAVLADAAPGVSTASKILGLLEKGFANNDPSPPATMNDHTVYLIYLPDTSSVTDTSNNAVSCTDWAGMHGHSTYLGRPYIFALLPDCKNGTDELTANASHELIEAVTDPYDPPNDGYYLESDASNPWRIEDGMEMSDLCDWEDYVQEGGFMLEKGWSNAAAATGGDPCEPSQAAVYASVFGTPGDVPAVAAGQPVTFTLTGWATGDIAPWGLTLRAPDSADIGSIVTQNPMLSYNLMRAGRSVTLTLTVPAGATRGQLGGVLVESGVQRHVWPVAYTVK